MPDAVVVHYQPKTIRYRFRDPEVAVRNAIYELRGRRMRLHRLRDKILSIAIDNIGYNTWSVQHLLDWTIAQGIVELTR